MRVFRQVVFFLFVLVYLIACPLVVLYALGYVLEPNAPGLVKTGLISLSTAPPGATVYLGHRRYTHRTPAILRNLAPGDYPIRLILKDHRAWTASVPVEAEQATVLDKILLMPHEFRRQELFAGPFEDLIPLPGTRFLLLTGGPRAGDGVIYDVREGRGWPLLPDGSPFADDRAIAWATARSSPMLIAQLASPEGRRVLRIDRFGEEPRVEDLTHLFLEEPLDVEWDPSDRRHLFAFQRGFVNRLDLAAKAVSPKWAEGVRGFGLFEKSVYLLRTDGALVRVDGEGNAQEELFAPGPLMRSLFGAQERVRITVPAKDVFLFLGERGELLAGRLPYRFVEKGVLGFDWYPRRALIWRRDALGILDFGRAAATPEPFGPVPELTWVVKRGKRIEQAFFVYEGSHALFRDDDRVFLLPLELEDSAQPTEAGHPANGGVAEGSAGARSAKPTEVIQIKTRSAVMYSDDTGKLYHLDRSTGALCSLEIVPKRERSPLPFPERSREP